MLAVTAVKIDAALFIAYFVRLLRGLPKHHRSSKMALTTVNANPNLILILTLNNAAPTLTLLLILTPITINSAIEADLW